MNILHLQIGVNGRQVLTPTKAKEFVLNLETYIQAQRNAGWKYVSIPPLGHRVLEIMRGLYEK